MHSSPCWHTLYMRKKSLSLRDSLSTFQFSSDDDDDRGKSCLGRSIKSHFVKIAIMWQWNRCLWCVSRFGLQGIVLSIVVIPVFLPVDAIVKNEIHSIDIRRYIDVKFKKIQISEISRMTSMLSFVFIGVEPTIEGVLDRNMFRKAGIGHPNGADEILFAEWWLITRNVRMFEFDLTLPDLMQINVGMFRVRLTIQAEESSGWAFLRRELFRRQSNIERPGLMFAMRLIREIEMTFAECWRWRW